MNFNRFASLFVVVFACLAFIMGRKLHYQQDLNTAEVLNNATIGMDCILNCSPRESPRFYRKLEKVLQCVNENGHDLSYNQIKESLIKYTHESNKLRIRCENQDTLFKYYFQAPLESNDSVYYSLSIAINSCEIIDISNFCDFYIKSDEFES